jgi:hypothetical protein
MRSLIQIQNIKILFILFNKLSEYFFKYDFQFLNIKYFKSIYFEKQRQDFSSNIFLNLLLKL